MALNLTVSLQCSWGGLTLCALSPPSYQALLRYPETQRRLLERFPTLEALPAFKPVMGRRLSDAEVRRCVYVRG